MAAKPIKRVNEKKKRCFTAPILKSNLSCANLTEMGEPARANLGTIAGLYQQFSSYFPQFSRGIIKNFLLLAQALLASRSTNLNTVKDRIGTLLGRADRQPASDKTDEIDIKMAIKKLEAEQFWCLSTKATAHFGLGERADYKKENGLIKKLKPKPAPWMINSYETQIKKLNEILNQPENLL